MNTLKIISSILAGLLFINNSCKSQDYILQVGREGLYCCGIPNPIKLIVENSSCEEIYIIVDNAFIEKDGCWYNIISKSQHPELINIFIYRNDRVIDTITELVQDIPTPDIKISGFYNPLVRRNLDSLIVSSPYEEFIHFELLDYHLKLVSRSDTIYNSQKINSYFTENEKSIFNRMYKGDLVILENIRLIANGNIEIIIPIKKIKI